MRKIAQQLPQTWRDLPARKKAMGIVAGLLVVGLIYALWPWRVDQVVRFDGGGTWQRESAPPRRLIVWQPAERLPLSEPASPTVHPSITPALTDGGATLYFSRRGAEGAAEILRSRFRDGRWQPPQPVAELNSPADDMGPTLSPTGRELYFYSNRPGGRGGYDLYVSVRENGRWSAPENLGPHINTPANEYDPCLDPTGMTLYFASNRTGRMARRASESEADSLPEWAGSLRAEPGEPTYDLYRAGRNEESGKWSGAAALAELNIPDSNEGAPAVSPDGAFLYFASDRPARRGEERNLDLYRARLVRGKIAGPAENLGPGINTAAHETEPALSPEGFRLLFASNRAGNDELYVSTATEVYEKVTRDTSALRALANPWLWAGLLCGLLLLWAVWLMYSHRGKLAEKVWPARFLAASLLINLCFVVLLFFWKLPGLVDAIVKQFQEPVPASRVVDEQTLQSEQTRETLYSEVADLPPVESAPADWPSEQNPAPSTAAPEMKPLLPEDDHLPLSHAVPAHVPQTVVAVRRPTSEPARDAAPEALSRKPPQEAVAMLPAEANSQLPKVESPPLENVPSQDSLERMQAARVDVQIPNAPELPDSEAIRPRETALPSLPASPDVTENSSPQAVEMNLARQSPRDPEMKQIARIEDSALKPVDQPAEEQIAPTEPAPREYEPPVVQNTLKIPEENPNDDGEPLLKQRPVVSDAKPAMPESLPFREPAPPEGLKKPAVPRQVAQVAELDKLPELKVPDTPTPTAEDQEAPPTEEMPAPPQRTVAKAISAAPEANSPIEDSLPVARSASIRELPRRAEPSLSRVALKPAASIAENTEPVDVQETAELSTLLALRNPDMRREMAEVFGNHPAEEAAVKRGLLWLARHQNEEGSWSLHEFHKKCQEHEGQCSGAGSERSQTAATGLALLPFLAAGHVPESKEYGPVVAKGLEWLIENQHEDGKLQGPGDNQIMYSHGIATIALCEAYAMTREPRLGEAAKKAVDFIVKAQHQSTGGWRYKPNEPGDTSVVGWQVMALKSAEMAGIAVPAATYEKVRHWLSSVEGQQPTGGVFGYTNRNPTPAMAAEGLLCLEFLGESRTSPRLGAGADYLLKHLPQKDQRHTSYYWYYAAQTLYHLQDERWSAWNEPLRKLLLETQQTDGPVSGTWTPQDQWEKRGGRIYTTALKLLMLEIEYRHLPLYGGLQPILQP